jgi:molybdopterin-containing oxidoreductase family iron-sulfur binding subunit
MHCDNPPCVGACPEHAIFQRPDGIVLIDRGKCMGHGECVGACPYGVIEMNPAQGYFPGRELPFEEKAEVYRKHPPGKAATCTLCAHRVDRGREPACVEGCPSKVMVFGDLDDPASAVSKKFKKSRPLRSSEGTEPKVTYIFPEDTAEQIEQRIIENPKMMRP